MATYTVEQSHKVWARRAQEIKKAGKKSSLESAKYMVAKAKSLAPRFTGKTMSGIRKRPAKIGYSVESWHPGKNGFKPNLWANNTKPYDNPRMWWRGYKPTRYGQGHRRTGMPRFFDIAVTHTRRHFNKGVLRHTRKALRVKF